MKERFLILQKVIAMAIIFALIMAEYAIIGITAISYAIDMIATNNDNVEFVAYFKNENEEVTEIESKIDEEKKLNIDVTVRNEGYFKGQISLQDAGFRIKEVLPNEGIEKFENGIIYLKQINADEIVKLEAVIAYFEDEVVTKDSLNQETKVALTGTYSSSSGNNEITGTSKVRVNWNLKDEQKAEIDTKLLANYVYPINTVNVQEEPIQENRKIVQLLVSSKITDNSFPTKETEITLNVPESATNVKVHKRTTEATNGDKEFTEANYEVETINEINQLDNTEITTKRLKIQVKNDPDLNGKIAWNKNTKDIYVVTYEFPENTDISAEKIKVNGKITTYDVNKETSENIVLTAEEKIVELSEEKEGIVSVVKNANETEIAKGKIYSKEDREYSSYTKVYVDYNEAIEKIQIEEGKSAFVIETKEIDTQTNEEVISQEEHIANVLYKAVEFTKDEITKVLGNTWTIDVKDQDNNKKTITNETVANQDGKIIVTLDEEAEKLKIETSKPQNNGAFVVITRKVISGTEYTRAELKEFSKLKEKTTIDYTKADETITEIKKDNDINLKETETNAKFEVEQTTLQAGEENTVNLTVVLESDTEEKDLFKEPEIKISFPEQVTYIKSLKCQVMYANGLTKPEEGSIARSNTTDIKFATITLNGEQTSYPGEGVEGTTLIITAVVDVDENAENSNQNITLDYTNNITGETVTKQKTSQIGIVAKAGTQQTNETETNNNENETNNTGTGEEQNSNTENTNQGETGSGNNSSTEETTNEGIELTLKAKVGGQEIANGAEVKAGEIITYTATIKNTTEENKNIILKATIPENTKLFEVNPEYIEHLGEMGGEDYPYYIERDNTEFTKPKNLEAGKTVTYTYMVKVNESITANVQGTNIVKILRDTTELATANITNNFVPGKISANIYLADYSNNADLDAGYVYAYTLNIKNLTSEQQNNIQVVINTNGLFKLTEISYIKGNNAVIINDGDLSNFTIESIPANTTLQVSVEGRILEATEDNQKSTISATIKDSNNNIYNSNAIINKILNSKVKIETTVEEKNEYKGYIGDEEIKYEIKIKNTGDKKINNLSIEDYFSKYLDLEEIKIGDKELTEEEYLTKTDLDDDIEIIYLYNLSIDKGEEIVITLSTKVKERYMASQDKLEVTNSIKIYNDVLKEMVNLDTVYLEIINETENEEENEENSNENNEDTENNVDNNNQNENNNNNEENNEDAEENNDEKIDDNEETEDNKNTEDGEQSIIPSDNNGEEIPSDTTGKEIKENTYTIKGTVWLDANGDGIKDSNEEKINGIKVYAIDVSNNKIAVNNANKEIIGATTNGEYILEGLKQGKYIVIFEYNTDKYLTTAYNVEKASESKNSDATKITRKISGEEKIVAATDTLSVKENKNNIDLGLIEAKVFDLELEKTVRKITVSNLSETTTYEYNNVTLAKLEINPKNLIGSDVAIEYTIKVKNKGEIPGYAKEIVDYMPSSLNFKEELNTEWSLKDKYLYNTNLANTIINPGEEKELKLILTKTMTESNTGLINNKAEIKTAINDKGIEDIDSTPGNNNDGEDDLGSADVIIVPSTGKIFTYIAIGLISLTAIAGAVYFINKKLIKEK